jgi:type II secretory pathway pseudopilin PulG
MIVVVIVGILAALALPRFSMVSHHAKVKEAELTLKHIYQAHVTWRAFSGEPTQSLVDLESVGYTAPLRMEFYDLPANPETGYALPLCLESHEPDAWPHRGVDLDGEFFNCTL